MTAELDPSTRLRIAVRQHMESLQRAGLTHLPRAARIMGVREDEAAADPIASPASSRPVPQSSGTPPTRRPAQGTLVDEPDSGPEETAPVTDSSTSKRSRAERCNQLAQLADRVAACTRCQELAETRTQTVFGVGNPEAEILFVGEAPGADEDQQGEPFVGRAGQLLNKIIEACQLTREEIYICNILRCRPPGNRNPTTEEAANCREYLEAQIRLVDPDYIVCWGSVAAHNLLDTTTPIGRMRQKFYQYGRAQVLCTYHPSYLLRNPSAKVKVWEDMKFFRRDMGVELDSK